jgi:rhodanese-related sulfurtransferase
MVQTIDTAELADLIGREPVDIIDVRDPNEWEGGHISSARNIPLETLREDPDKFLVHGKPLVFICKKGIRSLAAAKLAERFGYERVYNLDGGMLEWLRVGFPVLETRVAA